MQYLNKLDELIKQILEATDDVIDSNPQVDEDEEDIDEISVTGGMDGGEGPPRTPYAFSGKSKKDEKKKKKNATSSTGFELVGEIYDSNYKSYKKDESLNSRQKVNGSIKEISKRLMQIERILNRNIKLKKESGVNSGHYWKSTKQTMGKVSERLIRVAQSLRELSS